MSEKQFFGHIIDNDEVESADGGRFDRPRLVPAQQVLDQSLQR